MRLCQRDGTDGLVRLRLHEMPNAKAEKHAQWEPSSDCSKPGISTYLGETGSHSGMTQHVCGMLQTFALVGADLRFKYSMAP